MALVWGRLLRCSDGAGGDMCYAASQHQARAAPAHKEQIMAWVDDSSRLINERAQAAWRLPMGLASPLWALYGAAASGAVAYWWLTRWAGPVNIEAAVARIPVRATPRASAAVEEAAQPTAPPAAPDARPSGAAADDLTQLNGVGPKLSQALIERGVTRFADIAAWTEADLADIDAALSLKGRAVREAWVEQAKKLARDGEG